MCSTNLYMPNGFTLADNAGLADIETALAYAAGFELVDSVDGCQVFEQRHQRGVLRVVVLPPDEDPNADYSEIIKRHHATCLWNPLHNGKVAKLSTNHSASVTQQLLDDSGAYVGKWCFSIPQQRDADNRPLSSIKSSIVQVSEGFTGYNLLEVLARGTLSAAGRFKDVYLYPDNKGKWQTIALSAAQRGRVALNDKAAFHTRFIWFPGMNAYAFALATGRYPADRLAERIEAAKREHKKRKAMSKPELLHYLDNVAYANEGVFDDTRLPKGDLSAYL